MKHVSLLWKLLLLFLGVTVSIFVILNTLGLNIMHGKILSKTKEELYRNGTNYVSEYLLGYYENASGYQQLNIQLEMLSDMTDARIWLVSNSGLIVLDSHNAAVGRSLLE